MAEENAPQSLQELDGRPQPPGIYRWSVLVLASLAMAGNYYAYDAISPLADVLRDQLNFTDSMIGTLNGIYSLPNVVMVVIGGLIIDRIGPRASSVLFGALCSAGTVVTAISGRFYVMAAGRLIFGLGAESLIVAVTTALAKWFRGKELSFAFGINLTIARLGTVAAQNSPTFAKSAYESWQTPLWIACGVGSLCLIGSIFYFLMEAAAERRYSLGDADEPDKVKLKDVFRFSLSYWWVVALCITFYSAMFPFQTFAVKFFQDVHGMTRESGGFFNSLLPLMAMFATPLFGYAADRFGKRASMMIVGSAMIIPVYLMMIYTDLHVGVPVAIMGVSFALIPAVMWPSVAYLVNQSKLGTALGLMTMIQNIGLAGFNFLIGWANTHWAAGPQNPTGYNAGMWMFSTLGIFAVLFAYLLYRAETGPGAQGLQTITTKSSAEPA